MTSKLYNDYSNGPHRLEWLGGSGIYLYGMFVGLSGHDTKVFLHSLS